MNGSRCAFIAKVFLFLPGTVSQAGPAITGGFTGFFQLQNSKPVSGIDSGALISPIAVLPTAS